MPGAVGITFGDAAKDVPQATKSALSQMHQNLGHPSREDFVRCLRLGGADEQAVLGARHLQCSTCARLVKPKLARPARVQHTGDFNDDVGMDIVDIHDCDGVKYKALSIVELNTTFQVVRVIQDRSPETIQKAFNDSWVSWAGAPLRVVLDADGGFEGELSQMLRAYGSHTSVSASQSAWQCGRTERRGGWWKEMWQRTVQDQNISGLAEVEMASGLVSAAKNTLRRRCGFSPCQWVFGRDPKLPGCLVDHAQDIGAHSLAEYNTSIGRRFAIQTAARKAFVEMQNDDTLRRSLLRRTRVHRGLFSPGDRVFYWRDPTKGRAVGSNSRSAGGWKGPAVVIGHEGTNVWVSHHGRALLSSSEHLRMAVVEEMWAPNIDEQDLEAQVTKLAQLLKKDAATYEDIRNHVPYHEPDHDPERPAKRLRIRQKGKEPDASSTVPALSDVAPNHEELDVSDDVETPPAQASGDEEAESVFHVFMSGAADIFMLGRKYTDLTKQKQMEKEIPWGKIPQEQRPLYRSAAAKQWQEWMRYDSVRVLSLEESNKQRLLLDNSPVKAWMALSRDNCWKSRKVSSAWLLRLGSGGQFFTKRC